MTGADPTAELIRSMLERRSGAPVPDWILDRAMRAVATAPQTRAGRAGWPPRRIATRVAIAVPVFAAMIVLAVVLLPAAGRPGGSAPSPTLPAGVAAASVAPSPPAAPGTPPAIPGAPTPTPAATVSELAPDSLAIVTRHGDGLRVRSAPGTGPESDKLVPLLPRRTRLLVISGPVKADNYDWYEVLVERGGRIPDGMYGWVAAADEDGRWIRPAAVECRDEPRPEDVADLRPFDFFACYRGRELMLTAQIDEGQAGVGPDCPLPGVGPCIAHEEWLFGAYTVSLVGQDGRRRSARLTFPYTGWEDIGEGPLLLTVAMDVPEARSCRLTDPDTGRDLVPPENAIAVCRLALAVRDMQGQP